MLELFFPNDLARYEIMWKKYNRVGQATNDSMAHAHCMLAEAKKNIQTM